MRSPYILLSALFLWLFLGTDKAQGSDSNYEAAEKSYQTHQYNNAEIYLKNLLLENKEHMAAKLLLIKVYLAQGKGHLAETELKDAQRMGLNNAELTLMYAKAYTLQGQYNKSLQVLETLENSVDVSEKFYVEQGLAQIGLGHHKIARKTFKQALSKNPGNLYAKLGLAQVNLIEHNAARAVSLLDDVLSSYFPPLKAYVMKANILYQQGKLDQALSFVNKALAEYSQDLSSLFLRASIFVELHNFVAADEDLEQILNQVANEPRALFLKAIVVAQQQKTSTANNVLNNISQILENLDDKALEQFPSYYYLAGYTAFLQGNLAVAKGYLQQFLMVDEMSYRALRLSASIDFGLGNYMTALSTLKKANLEYPEDAAIHSLLGTTYLILENKEKALFYFKQAKSLASNTPLFDVQIAKALIVNEQPQQAEELLNIAINEQYKDAESIAILEPVLFESLVAQHKFEQALIISNKIVEKKPTAEALYQHGLIHLALNHRDEALRFVEQSLAKEPTLIPAITTKAEILFHSGATDKAISFTTQQLQKNTNAELAFVLAKFYRQLNDLQQSREKLLQAYQLAPENYQITKHYISLLVEQKQLDKAVDVAKAFLKVQQKEIAMYLLLADLYLGLEQKVEALQVIKTGIRLPISSADKATLHLKIATIYALSFNVKDAINEYQKAIAWHSDKSTVLALARYFRTLGRIDDSIKVIKRYQETIEHNEITLLYGQNLLSQQKLSLAMAQFNQVEALYPEAQVGKIHVLLAQGKKEQAQTYLKSRLALHSEHPLLMMTQAELFIKELNWTQALITYETIMPNYPDHTVYNNAAYSAYQLGDYVKAKRYAEQSLALNPKQTDTLDTLGLVLHAMSEYQAALPYYRKALVIDKNRPDIKFHLAQALVSLERNREAMNILAEVVNGQQTFLQKPEAKTLLEALIKNNR
ncbi:XrtA/PEP-CTERM system TPR-repeat protein PrsT [Thalassotalea hakodatensis]|uniref:XrtA/PEP-CTERM system TPR-repeat protein PrsT n=1 Tax=Thalassotalea hakodatensis TaxID=3030492 RepID=UPI0025733273|nr:XrtA/PEP-CTERM system TPR-repeat protein PrsT [Thalassotalea hakodatensis]